MAYPQLETWNHCKLLNEPGIKCIGGLFYLYYFEIFQYRRCLVFFFYLSCFFLWLESCIYMILFRRVVVVVHNLLFFSVFFSSDVPIFRTFLTVFSCSLMVLYFTFRKSRNPINHKKSSLTCVGACKKGINRQTILLNAIEVPWRFDKEYINMSLYRIPKTNLIYHFSRVHTFRQLVGNRKRVGRINH